MNIARSLSGALFFAFSAGSADAAPVTYSCDLLDGSLPDHRFVQVDQILVDDFQDRVDLRVSRTIGTSDPLQWVFVTRSDTRGDDIFTVQRFSSGTTLGAGIIGNDPHWFRMTSDGQLTWSFLSETLGGLANWFRWSCSN